MTKIFTYFRVVLVVLFLTLVLPVSAANVQIGELWYTLDDAAKTATVARHADYASKETITIPSTVSYGGSNYAVTAIAQQAFQDCSQLVNITIPEGVTTIGDWAFWKCVNLASLELPASMRTIGASVFSFCSSLYSVNIPSGVTTIGEFSFRECNRLMSVSLPSTLKVLEQGMFTSCTNLTTVVLPANLEEIRAQAFYMSAIRSLTIPSSVTTMGVGVFGNCSLLESVTLPENITAIDAQMFYNCSALRSVKWSSQLKSIGYASFYGCKSLDNIVFPETVDNIDELAFYGSGITKFVVPDKISHLNKGVLYGCTALTNVVFHDNVTSIGEAAFQGCTSLVVMMLPPKVTSIANRQFSGCSSLALVGMPSGITSIGESAFHNCVSIRELDITEKITEIGNGAFLGCSKLKAFNVAESNPAYKTVDGVLYDKGLTVLLMFPNGKQGACQIPSSVTRIDDYALNSCSGLTAVNIPENLKVIGISAFANCSNLADIDFSEGLETIGDNAFFGCSALVGTLRLPQSVKSIGKWAFNYCNRITDIILPNGNTVIGEAAFSNTSVSNMIFPEGITELGIPATVGDYSVMDGCNKLTCAVLPSTLEKMRPFGLSSSRFSTIYSHALVPPVLVGFTSNSVVSSIMVPKGQASEYEQAWGDLYPMADFFDVLPGAPEVTTSAIGWDVYSAAGYPATPVRYQLSISTGSGALVKEFALDACGVLNGTSSAAPADGHIAYVITGVGSGNYKYDLKGYAAEGQLVYAHTGDITVESTGINDVVADGDVIVSGNTVSSRNGVEIRVYGFDGALVAVTSDTVTLPTGMYVVVTGGKAMKIAVG